MRTRSEVIAARKAEKKIPEWERGANEEQLQVIRHETGPCRVVAGAGAGKTHCVTRRVVRLVELDIVPAERILATTFSKKAADEMNKRLKELGVSDARVGTWHSLCLQILRKDHTKWADWEIDGSNDKPQRAKYLLKEVLGYKHMDWKSADLSKVNSFIGRCKANLFAPDSEEAAKFAEKEFSWDGKKTLEAFHRYNQLLEEKEIITYDDFMVFVVEHLSSNEDARQTWASKWDQLMCDECLVGETPVLLDETGRTMTIREMVETRYSGTVLAHKRSQFESIEKRVIGWHKIALDRQMVRITVRQIGLRKDGSRFAPITEKVRYRTQFVAATVDHLIWTSIGWRAAGTIRVGDEVVVETSAKADARFANRMKIGDSGRRKLSRLMRKKNASGACGSNRVKNARGPITRGGNGKGPTVSEAALLERLGDGWVLGYVVNLPPGSKSIGLPTHYKVDLANTEKMIAVEVDGASHDTLVRRTQDIRKTNTLEAMGWTVVRIRNDEVPTLYGDLLAERVYNSPAPAEVIAVEPWTPTDPFVYDIDVEDEHNFYADGVVVHNCQDNNAAQQRITHLLADDHRNYMAVGDHRQAIYGFRASSPEFIAKFEEEWKPDAKTIWLPRNYRSGKKIIDVANQIIRPMKLDGFELKDMIGERQLDGEVKIACAEALDDEANIVVDCIAKSVNAGDAEYSSHTVLYRLNAQSRAVEEALLKQRIPYVVVGGVSFYERREVRDLLAYLRLAAGRAKVEDIKRSINTPFRFLGAKFVERVMAEVDEDVIEDANWPAIVDLVSNQDRIQSRQRASARDWSLMIRAMQDKIKQAAAIEDAPTSPDSPEAKVKELARPAVLLEDVVRQTRYIEWLQKEEGGETTENSGPANVREMVRVAERFPSTEELLDYVDHTIRASKKQREDKQAGGNRVILMSIHRCVSPDTLVETARGLVPIAEIPEDGTIGTTEGPRPYVGKVSYTDREMLRVTTTSGYVVEVTTDHRMMAWKGGAYEEIEAQNLERGQFLRLALGESVEVVDEVRLPKAPAGDVRANVYSVPEILDESVAELFGLLVADGTVFDRGFRLSKRYADVVDRFVELTKANFGASPSWEEIPLKNKLGVYYGATVSSTILAAWLLSMRGFGPHAKAVPAEILRSPLRVQAKFLRGLFEDGTVNVKGSRLDHVAFTTCYAEMAKVVQTMLLRFGIICSRRSYGGLWRLSIYGANAERFAAHIGFVSARKNAQLASAQAGPETRYLVPVDRARFRGGWDAWGDLVFFAQNAVARGYITRDAAAKYGYEEGLRYHHERIVSIEAFRGSAMCVTVPSHGRFLQNGFDGCNSKGLEWPHVYVIGMNESILPHIKGDVEEERRVAYVAATRARDFLMLSYVRRIATRAGVKDAAPSRFLLDTGLPLDVPRDVPEETAAFPETPSVTPG